MSMYEHVWACMSMQSASAALSNPHLMQPKSSHDRPQMYSQHAAALHHHQQQQQQQQIQYHHQQQMQQQQQQLMLQQQLLGVAVKPPRVRPR